MKFCLVCRNTRLKKSNRETRMWLCERVLYVQYECNNCKRKYTYCVICMKLMDDKHEKHLIPAEPKTYARGVNIQNNDASYFYSSMVVTFGYYDPQLYLLKLHENFISNDFITRPFDYWYRVELTEKTKFTLLHNNYSCILCGMNYEAFPCRKLVNKHLKSCKGAKAMREGSLVN